MRTQALGRFALIEGNQFCANDSTDDFSLYVNERTMCE